MKLNCKVEVVNRLHSNLNVGTRGKYVKSTLALCKEPKNAKEYFILHFSSINKSGNKYKLNKIKQVFVKCLNEGKITIRFDEPPHDLCVISEVIQLKSFLRLMKLCITGEHVDSKVLNVSSAAVTVKDNAPTKLTVLNRSDIPTKGFPRTLEYLNMSGIKLFNFRRDILLLRLLTVLDLSNNEIQKIPPEFGRMQNLSELYLANNSLGIPQTLDWRWLLGPQITQTLKLIDLSGNSLKGLPSDIWKLQSLITLKLDNNLLERLPVSIGRLTKLRYFTVSRNNLKSLPCSLMRHWFDKFDISENKFENKNTSLCGELPSYWNFCVGSLVHIASKAVVKHNIYYAPNIIPLTLVEFLDNAHSCVCGNPVFNDLYIIRTFSSRDCFRMSTLFNNNVNSEIDFECYFCSPKCLMKCSVSNVP